MKMYIALSFHLNGEILHLYPHLLALVLKPIPLTWQQHDSIFMEFQIPSDTFQLQVDQRQSLRGRRGQGRSEISPTLEGFRCHIAHSCVVKTSSSRGFPGGQVVKTLCFHCRGASLISGWGIKIPHNRSKKKKMSSIPHFTISGCWVRDVYLLEPAASKTTLTRLLTVQSILPKGECVNARGYLPGPLYLFPLCHLRPWHFSVFLNI